MLGFIPALCLNYEADVFSLIVAQCTLRSVFVAGQYRGRQQIPRETRLAKCRNILCPVTFRGARYTMVQDLEFDLFKMFNGGFDHPIRVGKLPPQVLRKLDWQCGEVYLHPQTAQKIKWHDQGRAIPYDPGPALLNAIAYGDIAQVRTGHPQPLPLRLPVAEALTPRVVAAHFVRSSIRSRKGHWLSWQF